MIEKMKLHLPLYEKLSSIYGQVTIVLAEELFTSRFNKEKSKKMEYSFENITVLQPKSITEFKNIFKNEKCIVINNFSEKWYDWYVWYILKRMKIPIVRIFNRNPLIDLKVNTLSNKKYSIFSKLFYKVFIYLVNIGVFSKVDTYFYSGKNILSNKTSNIKEEIHINNILYDNFLEKRFDYSDEYIVFLDSKVTYSEDQIKWGYDLIDSSLYYYNLNLFFDEIEKVTKKKVIICAHPMYNMDHLEEDYLDRKVVKFETDEYISKASFVMFHHTSAMYSAVLMDKPVLLLECSKFNEHIKRQVKMYQRVFDFKTIDFFNYKNLKFIIENLQIDKDKYNKFKNDYLVSSYDKSSIDIISETIEKKYLQEVL